MKAVAVCGVLLVVAASLAAMPLGAHAQAPASNDGDTTASAGTDRIFAQWDRSDSPGCAVGVFRGGRIAYARGYGMANLDLGVALSPHSVLDIGSTSKQFTAMAVVLLAQQGKLSLDDDVRRHIPELPAYEKPVTVRHLLTHTSGLRDYRSRRATPMTRKAQSAPRGALSSAALRART